MKPWLVPTRARRKEWAEPPFWALDAFRFPLFSSTTADKERIENDFEGYVQAAYKGDSIVWGCIDRRQQVFSQARFAWRERRNGVLGDFFGSPELSLLESPWPNGTTGELLSHMETDASLAGNSYWTTCDDFGRLGGSATGPGRRLVRMRPDWVTLVLDAPSGNPYGLDARVVAYLFEPNVGGGGAVSPEPVTLLPSEVCHYSPKPDPVARFRGMSWLTPVLEEITADKAATRHKGRFFRNGATPNMAIKFDKDTAPEAFAEFVEGFNAAHQGTDRAYKTLFLSGGADIQPLSIDFRQLDFKATQGAGETRIALSAGVPAPILGISEGLQGSSLNAGNFGASRRLFVDTTIRDLWNKVAPSLQVLVPRPNDRAELTVDDRYIPFLREDARDRAEIRAKDAGTLRTLSDGGWKPDAAVAFVTADDLKQLRGQHTGLIPVQLQPPGAETPHGAPDARATDPSMNGRANADQVAAVRR